MFLKVNTLLKNLNTLNLRVILKKTAELDKINININIKINMNVKMNMNIKTNDNLNINMNHNKFISKTHSNKPEFPIKDKDQITRIQNLWIQVKGNKNSKVKIKPNTKKKDLRVVKINNSPLSMQINFSKNMDLKTHFLRINIPKVVKEKKNKKRKVNVKSYNWAIFVRTEKSKRRN